MSPNPVNLCFDPPPLDDDLEDGLDLDHAVEPHRGKAKSKKSGHGPNVKARKEKGHADKKGKRREDRNKDNKDDEGRLPPSNGDCMPSTDVANRKHKQTASTSAKSKPESSTATTSKSKDPGPSTSKPNPPTQTKKKPSKQVTTDATPVASGSGPTTSIVKLTAKKKKGQTRLAKRQAEV